MCQSPQSQYFYVTTCIVPSRDYVTGAETEHGQIVLTHHKSIRELQQWVEYNNMVLGTPRVFSPYFSVEHVDGSCLSPQEFKRVQSFASDALCQKRTHAGLLSAIP